MTTQIQHRGTAQAAQEIRTLASREIDINTTDWRINIHNGSTPGGIQHANSYDVQNNEWTYAVATGTDSIVISLAVAPTIYQSGQSFKFKAAATNTGSATLNVDSLGAKTIKKKGSSSLEVLDADDIILGGIYEVTYDGTDFIIDLGVSPVQEVLAGDIITHLSDIGVEQITTSTTLVTFYTLYMPFTGIARFKFTMKAGGGGTAIGRWYVNGVYSGTQHSAGASFSVKTQDITIAPGDVVTLQVRRNAASGNDDPVVKDVTTSVAGGSAAWVGKPNPTYIV